MIIEKLKAYYQRQKNRMLMTVSVLQSTEHKGCRIYVMQFGTVFMRLFVHEGQVYQYHAFIRPNPFLYFLYFIGFRETPFTIDELEGGRDTLLNNALDSIEEIKKKKD